MSVTQFQVVFDNPAGLYYTGQTLAGHILLNVASPLDTRGVVIRITGSTEVKWSETHSRERRTGRETHRTTHTIVYCSNEIYFADKYYLVGGPDARIILAPGQHVYAFQKLLSPNLPSNYEGTFGSVRYSVEASIDRPWAIDNKCLAAFTVISPIDLRLHPTAPFPIERVVEKKFSYIWRSAGKLTLTLRMPFGGYVSGQEIPITVTMENNSEVEITGITCRLRRTTDFLAMNPHRKTKTEKNSIGVVRFGTVNPKSSRTETRSLGVPIMPAYNLMPCSVIDMTYDLKVDVAVGMFHRDVTLRVPIVIGTIPVEGTMAPLVHVYANSDGIPVGTMRGFQPGGANNDFHGDHAGLLAGGSTGAIMQGGAHTDFHGDHAGLLVPGAAQNNNARLARPTQGQVIDDLPPPYHIAVQGVPMNSKSTG